VHAVCDGGVWVSKRYGALRGAVQKGSPPEMLEIHPIGRGITHALNGSRGRLWGVPGL
jgi:hypothetical protein